MRCPDCASLRGSVLYKVEPHRLVLATIASLVAGIIGTFVLMSISFFVFFIGPAYGGIMAEIVLWCSGRKRGPAIEAIGVGGIVVGALLVMGRMFLLGLYRTLTGVPNPVDVVPFYVMGAVWPLIGVGLAISTCYYRLK